MHSGYYIRRTDLTRVQAIRAIRHPERYGPRASAMFGPNGAGGYVPAQSRARGLTRAILDTFPIVKFGRTDDHDVPPSPQQGKDVESVGESGKAKERDEGETSLDM